MSDTASVIAAALGAAGDTSAITDVARVGGGMISRAARITTGRGSYLLKWLDGALPGVFAAEAQGLGLLAECGAVRIPTVLAHHNGENGETSFLLLEWLDTGAPTAQMWATLGERLAHLHSRTGPAYGLDHDNYIGTTPQQNAQNDDWLAFFRDQRLGPQIALAERNGLLPTGRAKQLDQLLGRLDRWLGEHQPAASLLHGDLWQGNVLCLAGGQPALIDPAVYHGDRETDLAYSALFQGFPSRFYSAYHAAWPLPDGWRERVPIYNLYHLLNHLNIFGETYGPHVDAVLRRM